MIVKGQCSGECYLIRYADDFVCCFQNEYEARVFREKLEERFARYGLEPAEEKMKILVFGRFARQNRERRGKGNQIPLTSLASRSIAEWTERSSFSVAE